MVRVEKMFEEVQSKLPGQPQFLLCVLPERKNSDLYGKVYLGTLKYDCLSEDEVGNFFGLLGPWKKKNLAEFGIVTQCIAPTRVNDQYLTNVLLKINAKVSIFLGVFLLVSFSPFTSFLALRMGLCAVCLVILFLLTIGSLWLNPLFCSLAG